MSPLAEKTREQIIAACDVLPPGTAITLNGAVAHEAVMALPGAVTCVLAVKESALGYPWEFDRARALVNSVEVTALGEGRKIEVAA